MGRYLNWYLVALERSVAGKMDDRDVACVIGEVEARLSESATELTPECRDAEEAEQLAIKGIGSPLRLGERLCGWVSPAVYWSDARAPMLTAFAIGVWLCLGYRSPYALAIGAAGAGIVAYLVAEIGRPMPVALAIAVAAATFFGVLLSATAEWASQDSYSCAVRPSSFEPGPRPSSDGSGETIVRSSPRYEEYRAGFWTIAGVSPGPRIALGATYWLLLVTLGVAAVPKAAKGVIGGI